MRRNITRIEVEIAKKEGYLALVHTRLGFRAQREGIELCRDTVEIQLMSELTELNENVAALQLMINEVIFLYDHSNVLMEYIIVTSSYFPHFIYLILSFQAHASLRYLLKTQVQLEEDLNVKTNTLKIDQVDCMTLRQSIIFHSY